MELLQTSFHCRENRSVTERRAIINFDFLSLPYWFKPRKFERIFSGATRILTSTIMIFDRFQFTGRVHSLSSGKVAATPILKSVPSQFRLLFSKLQSRCTITRQFSSKVAHKSRDKEKITAIYCLWMADNERGREWK